MRLKFSVSLFILMILTLHVGRRDQTASGQEVGPVADEVRGQFDLDPFYEKHLDVGGLPIVGSSQVSDAAILEAGWIVNKMLGERPDILRSMANQKTRLAVMAYTEYTTDVPEHRHLGSEKTYERTGQGRVYWDRRARGLGATPSAPAVSCAEENVLCYPGDPYSTENICIHEFAHAIHSMGMPEVDPMFDRKLKAAYDSAIAEGLWKDTYASVNRQEYWAESVQSWFDDNREQDALHNHVNTRAELKEYDPGVAVLCEQVFGDGEWRYVKPRERDEAGRAHLSGIDFDNLPTFKWRDEPMPEVARVLIQTTAGDIELELNSKQAPKTVENFLNYVHQGLYADGIFHRTVTDDNQGDRAEKINVVQASADPSRRRDYFEPIPLERTSETGILHMDGTISMARMPEPDTGLDQFFICIGDQPGLDFGGERDPTGQGYAAFGKVVRGMEVVHEIHRSPAEGQRLKPPIRIQRAIRLN